MAYFFFVSYAHSAPTGDEAPADTDRLVRTFFSDLAAEVRRAAHLPDDTPVGFIDDHIEPGSNWNAMLTDALASAEMFVALYSPAYLNSTWQLRERESFQRRMRALPGAGDGRRHLLPVLWSPLLSWHGETEARDALAIAADIAAYTKNGLRALCMLSAYKAQYTTVVERIASRIVDVATNYAAGPSWAPPPEGLEVRTEGPRFVVAVLARTKGDRLPGTPDDVYGAQPREWRPFAELQAMPLAEYVARTADRLGLAASTVNLADAPTAVGASAAVLLVDPWMASGDADAERLGATLRSLPDWVMPVVVVDRRDPRYRLEGLRLAERVAGLSPGPAEPRVVEATDMRHFMESIPVLVTEARRRYLKLAPAFTPKSHQAPSLPTAIPPLGTSDHG